MTSKTKLKIENCSPAYADIDEAAKEFERIPIDCHSEKKIKSEYYCKLEKSLSTLWKNIDSLTEENVSKFFKDSENIECHFVKLLLSKNIKALPNVAQRSGAKFLIIDNELKKTWTHGTKNVDGWLKLDDYWVPYDVKKHTTSCLGFTFSELHKYIKGHKDVIFVVYDKQEDNSNTPEIILSLSHLYNNQVFTGPIEDTRMINGTKKKIITGTGLIVPKDSEYALFKTQTFRCKDKKEQYVCPQFNEKSERVEEQNVNGFINVLNILMQDSLQRTGGSSAALSRQS